MPRVLTRGMPPWGLDALTPTLAESPPMPRDKFDRLPKPIFDVGTRVRVVCVPDCDFGVSTFRYAVRPGAYARVTGPWDRGGNLPVVWEDGPYRRGQRNGAYEPQMFTGVGQLVLPFTP